MSQQILKQVLKEKKQRMTAQRESILKAFIESKGRLLTIDEVYMKIRRNYSHKTSRMTVKRNIEILEEIGVVRKIEDENGCPRYELIVEVETESKVLFICKNCRKTLKLDLDLDIEKLKEILPYEDIDKNLEIADFELKLYGLCKDCK